MAGGDRGQERDFAQTDCGMRAEGTGHRRAISNSRQNTAAAHCSHHEHYDCSGLESAMLGNVSLTDRQEVDRERHIYINEIFIGCLTRFQFSFKSTQKNTNI